MTKRIIGVVLFDQFEMLDVHFANATLGWAVGGSTFGGQALTTKDGGAQWTLQDVLPASGLFSVYFVDTMTGWAVGRNGYFIKTVDGGAKWTSKSLGDNIILRGVHFVDMQFGWAVGEGGSIYKTVSGGDPLGLP